MEEILHQLIGALSHYLQGFNHLGGCRICSIHRIVSQYVTSFRSSTFAFPTATQISIVGASRLQKLRKIPHSLPKGHKNSHVVWVLPSGKQPHKYGKSPFLLSKLTISMAMFNSKLSNYQRVTNSFCSAQRLKKIFPRQTRACGFDKRPIALLIPTRLRPGRETINGLFHGKQGLVHVPFG